MVERYNETKGITKRKGETDGITKRERVGDKKKRER